ncbi:MAG: hypothetical protein EBT45_08425, partial [Alphaproteobacteria bacterium]|nr:hypothetical protein [Alphaproteobacteria bacterium]
MLQSRVGRKTFALTFWAKRPLRCLPVPNRTWARPTESGRGHTDQYGIRQNEEGHRDPKSRIVGPANKVWANFQVEQNAGYNAHGRSQQGGHKSREMEAIHQGDRFVAPEGGAGGTHVERRRKQGA